MTGSVSHSIATAEELARALGGRRSGAQWMARCPAHEDANPSLSISDGKDGKVLVHCHAGCSQDAVLAALRQQSLWPEPTTSERLQHGLVATYDYTDENGELLYQVLRYEPKDFRQRRPDGCGGWIRNVEGVRKVLYRLPKLLAAATEPVFLVEGEKDVHSLERWGLLATCNPRGAGGWREEYGDVLRGRECVILLDNDDVGRKHALTVAESLLSKAAPIRVIELPDLPHKGDVTDWIRAGGTIAQLRQLYRQTDPLTPDSLKQLRARWASAKESVRELTASSGLAVNFAPDERIDTTPPWPDPLREPAYHGLVGEIVREMEPQTEADPVALLLHFLVGVGNLWGRGPHFRVGGAKHYTNLNAVLVGATSSSRKGTAKSDTFAILRAVDPTWTDECVMSGLSSGEGVIFHVRDPHTNDEGIADKRLMVLEPEFASVLRVAARDGNTLSAILRQAWDTGRLRVMNKNSPVKATGAHISIIGHITRDELVANLTATDKANGFANRFLWLCVKRSKLLPDGGDWSHIDAAGLTRRLSEAVGFARGVGEVKRDEEAGVMWRGVYGELSRERPGMFGAITARAEAQTMRVAMVYALLDKSCLVRRPHLEAALELWRYCEESARFIFGDALGNQTADRILQALKARPDGMTRTEIREMFHRNRSSAQIEVALRILAQHGLARAEKQESGGRPTERWVAALGPTR